MRPTSNYIEDKIDKLCDNLVGKVEVLENRVKILETENEQKDQDIRTLRYTVVNMQKSLNHLDSKERNLNVIISGLLEEEMTSGYDADTVLTTDGEKVRELLEIMECRIFSHRSR